MNTNNKNPLLCDIETGACDIPSAHNSESEASIVYEGKPIKIIYYTDPICSSCWGIEPQLRKLKLEYRHCIEIEYRMGGLLPNWSYNSGGISKPSDVAKHWDDVSMHYDMPIDGDVWLEDPLESSYPSCIVFKAAQLQDEYKAIHFLRRLRELLFLEKKNINKWEFVEISAKHSGLNIQKLKEDYENAAVGLFEEDLSLANKLGVRGFPSLFFFDKENNQEIVYGTKPYEVYENAILKLAPESIKNSYDTSEEFLFEIYNSMTIREFSELSSVSREDSNTKLQKLFDEKKLNKITSKNGSLYYK